MLLTSGNLNTLPGEFRLFVDKRLRQTSQFFIGITLLLESLLQQLRLVLVPQLTGIGPDRAVCRNFVMFHALSRSDEGRVLYGRRCILVHEILSFVDDAHYALALLALGSFSQLHEDLLQP